MNSMTPPHIGARLDDRYELVEPIANGGMAQVWRATDTVLGRSVAVKVLHPHLASDRGFVIRFRREAIAAARLSHPSIVSIYDTVSDDGLEAIVMELLQGRTLRAVLDEVHHLSPTDGIDLGMQIADALDEAHRGGVVHRDIKPSNIMLCDDRRVMVTDFGIAKAGEDTDLTVTGTLLGTAKYLSPEQVQGESVDPRADLYALGIVLFEAMAGRPPFRADTDAATALARLHTEPPRIRHLRPEVPQGLDDIVFRLMARDPGDRFSRAVDVRTALSGVEVEAVAADPTLIVDATSVEHTHGDVDHHVGHHVGLDDQHDPHHPYEQHDQHDQHEVGFLRSERSWLGAAFLVLLVGGSLVLAGALLNRSPIGDSLFDDPTTDTTAGETADTTRPDDVDDTDGAVDTTTTDLTDDIPDDELIEPGRVAARAIDPDGDGTERPELVPLGIDGNRSTSWKTETYRRPEYGGGLKGGVGFEIDLGGPARVREVDVVSVSENWSAQIFVGDDFSTPRATWGDPAGEVTSVSGNQTISLDGRGRYLLLWITDHGTSPDGEDEGDEPDHRFELAELDVR